MAADGPVRVMIVDDSAVVRQTLTHVLQSDGDIRVISAVSDPIFAMKFMESEWPDVVILDIEMPRMDGLTFLKKIMSTRPLPVIICSSLTVKGAQTTLDALAAGAVDIVAKPTSGLKSYLEEASRDLVRAVKGAAKSSVKLTTPPIMRFEAAVGARSDRSCQASPLSVTTDRIIAIGSSTGGTVAVEALLRALPVTTPGIVIVQHMPVQFTSAFAQRLNSLCELNVQEAGEGQRVLPGHVYIARGGIHLQVERRGGFYYTHLKDGPQVCRHRPSVNVLFQSVATAAGSNAKGFILTGMGDDGARGLLQMRNAGAETFAQDEKSCVVFGMPNEAIKIGAVGKVVDLMSMPPLMT
ncbi:MAG: two-component system, chemotaxis family, response regulator CheB [Marinobacter excellens HL-55]|uniref:Protein-glutamate methylesterase/protein-glutamine glutaminase n=1 Tax=Marinobacter excellens HL-55 TaxID=1305731 RepID=A0A0P7Z264_9GAMM|nr:MAG: two-component system, chemotaxis family, response regulator CheB [Marinobacter excellens HL-55]